MKKKPSAGRTKHPIPWIGIITVVLLSVAAAWSIRMWINRPAPVAPPSPIRAKVPPLPQTVARQATEQPPAQFGAPTPTADMPAPAPAEPIYQPPDTQGQGMPPTAASAMDQPKAAASEPPADTVPTPEPVIAPQMQAKGSRAPLPLATPPAAPPEPESAPVANPVQKAQAYTIQVGAYLSQANAEAQMAKLKKNGYEPFIFRASDAKQRVWHTVRIGRYATREEALVSLAAFREKEKMAAVVARADAL